MTSPASTTSPTDLPPPNIIPQAGASHVDLTPDQISTLFTETFTGYRKTLQDLQSAPSLNSRVARRISNFIEVADDAIAAISTLKLMIVGANDPKNVPSRQTEDTIDAAYMCALTALNNMYTILGLGSYCSTEPGVASQNLAGGIARYLDNVKAEHKPTDFWDEYEEVEEEEEEEGGGGGGGGGEEEELKEELKGEEGQESREARS